MSESIILIGGSGHARVIIDCIRASGGEVFGILDDGLAAGTEVLGVQVLGKTADYEQYADHPFLIAIGSNAVRRKIAGNLKVRWATAVHPSAVVSPYASIGEGTVVMPRAVINAGAAVFLCFFCNSISASSILHNLYINLTFVLTFPPPCTILFNYDRKRRKSYVHENEERQCP